MNKVETIDYFADPEVGGDPYGYWRDLRSQCPVFREPHHGVMMVTGYDEAVEVLCNPEVFSSSICVTGPIPPLPFEPEGDDIREQLEAHRAQLPWASQFITFDAPQHMAHRMLLTRLLTHSRLKANEDYIDQLAGQLIDSFIGRGHCELVSEYAQALATLVIADLLGVPEADRGELVKMIGPSPATVGNSGQSTRPDPLKYLDERFTGYLEERRRNPRDDMLSDLANSKFRDGSLPDLEAVVHIASFLFVAGQDTSAKLMASVFRSLGECPHLQQQLRSERHRTAEFVEETLRRDSPAKNTFRIARSTTTVGGVDIPAGTILSVGLAPANRDPAHFDSPDEFQLGRDHLHDHIAFGRGAHACPGSPLARLEARITLDHFLDRTSDIRIAETHHGPPDARRFSYAPTYTIRGLQELYLEFTPAH